MAMTNEEIVNAVAQKSVMDIVEIIKMMEEKFGVSAALPVAVATAPTASSGEGVAEEKTEFDIHMKSFGSNKIAVIKVVRAITSLGLKEAKDMVEGVPVVVKESIAKEEAEKIAKLLKEAGAEVEIK